MTTRLAEPPSFAICTPMSASLHSALAMNVLRGRYAPRLVGSSRPKGLSNSLIASAFALSIAMLCFIADPQTHPMILKRRSAYTIKRPPNGRSLALSIGRLSPAGSLRSAPWLAPASPPFIVTFGRCTSLPLWAPLRPPKARHRNGFTCSSHPETLPGALSQSFERGGQINLRRRGLYR
jgi:hypothetical protein